MIDSTPVAFVTDYIVLAVAHSRAVIAIPRPTLIAVTTCNNEKKGDTNFHLDIILTHEDSESGSIEDFTLAVLGDDGIPEVPRRSTDGTSRPTGIPQTFQAFSRHGITSPTVRRVDVPRTIARFANFPWDFRLTIEPCSTNFASGTVITWLAFTADGPSVL